jgi:hypothetical protein
MEVIIVEWEKVNVNFFLNGKMNDGINNRPEEYGLYQIYSSHLIYGPNSLVYIGKAYDQPILKRLKSHNDYWFNEESDEVTVYIGKLIVERLQFELLSKEEIDKIWRKQVDDAEKLLIFNCAPAYNSNSIVDHRIENKDLILFNYGKRGQLPLELSTLYDNSVYWHEGNGGELTKKSDYIENIYNEKKK